MGISGAGKDYLADFLIYSHNFQRFSFSDQLKKLANIIYPWMNADYPPIEKENNLNVILSTGETIVKSPREIWLHLNFLRDIENLIFIRMLENELIEFDLNKKVQSNDKNRLLISDVRTDEELAWCRKNGFKILYIHPIKKVYQEYDFDKQIKKNKIHADFIFENAFNGIDEFNQFYIEKIDNEYDRL